VGVYSTLPIHPTLGSLLQGIVTTRPLLSLLCLQVASSSGLPRIQVQTFSLKTGTGFTFRLFFAKNKKNIVEKIALILTIRPLKRTSKLQACQEKKHLSVQNMGFPY
jgi:hypothetical protein